jgi:RimJ/RimL family protein N-acetyltransferase
VTAGRVFPRVTLPAERLALFGTDWAAMIAEIHYWTAPWARGRGYAAEAARSPAGR